MMPEQRSKNFEKVKRYYDNSLWKIKRVRMQFLDGLHQKNLNLLLVIHMKKDS